MAGFTKTDINYKPNNSDCFSDIVKEIQGGSLHVSSELRISFLSLLTIFGFLLTVILRDMLIYSFKITLGIIIAEDHIGDYFDC